MKKDLRRMLTIFIVFAFIAVLFQGIFVMTTSAAVSTYYISPTGDDNNNGTSTSTPWKNLSKANSVMQPGDTVYIMGGTYAASSSQVISPSVSGTSSARITYAAYQGQTPYFYCTTSFMNTTNKDYITVKGITVDCQLTGSWGEWTNDDYNILQDCVFKNSAENNHGLLLNNSTYNQFLSCQFLDHGGYQALSGCDAVKMVYSSNYNLIDGCYFNNGAHTTLNVCSAFNRVRNCTFNNDNGQAAECQNASSTMERSRYNVWENNVFTAKYQGTDGKFSPGLEMPAKQNIYRYNVMYECQGGAIELSGWNWGGSGADWDYAEDVVSNRIYNNVFYNSGYGGLHIARYEDKPNLDDQIFKNNISYKNYLTDTGLGVTNAPVQVYIQDWKSQPTSLLPSLKFYGNLLSAATTGQNVIFNVAGYGNNQNSTLSTFRSQYPNTFYSSNYEANPLFVNESTKDFHLQSGSPCIDAGVDLTYTSSSGSNSTSVSVQDVLYFSAGIPDVVAGDSIKVGSNSPVTITAINYSTNTLTVSSPISWSANTAVNLTYNGNAPDTGAFEYGGAAPTSTPTPTPATTPTPTPTPAESELLSNPGFENGADGSWVILDVGTATYITSGQYNGTKGMKVSGRVNTWDSVCQDVKADLLANSQGNYSTSGWIKLGTGSDTGYITVETNDGGGTHYFHVTTTIGTSYTNIAGTLNITWTGTLNSAKLYPHTNASKADLYADDMSLKKQGGATPTPTPTPATTPTPTPAGTPTPTPTPAGTELLSNPGFENGTTSWFAWDGSIASYTSQKHSGSYSVRSYNRSIGEWCSPAQDIKPVLLANGQGSYTAKAWVRLASGSDSAKPVIRINDGSGLHYINPTFTNVNSTSWTECSWSANVSWSGTLNDAYLYLTTNTSKVDMYVDDCSLKR